MYETYFKLHERPFAAVPQVDHYYPAASIEAARTSLLRCLQRGEGIAVAIGPAGTGKTLLCQIVARQLQDSFPVAVVASGRLNSRRALLQAVLYGLGRPYRDMDEGELRLALIDYLTTSENCPRGIVLVVDEAHRLPLRLLDEIRTLTNLTRDNAPAVRLALAGDRTLEERFASPRLESFSQRITARCYLEAFNRCETQDYIQGRIRAAGGTAQLFPPETCACVYKATDGVPRLVNQVCEHAMLLACAAGCRQLTPAHIAEAWADLQQLPTPWNESQQESSGVIEFGGLDDEADSPCPPQDSSAPAAEVAAPTLRISPPAEEGESDALEPADQLRCIQEMLADVQQAFQPTGAIGPEVELVLDEPDQLFHERFEQEEVVADRYPPAPEAERRELPVATAVAAEAASRCGAGVQPASSAAGETLAPSRAGETPAPQYLDGHAPMRRREYAGLFARLRRGEGRDRN
jgi:type II secretory pathway predicted ATPase ExeA